MINQGGDKLTLNLNGCTSSTTSPTSPKICNLSSLIPPLVPTLVNVDNCTSIASKNENVTVTHFSDLHGGVVEKISIPVTSSNNNEKRTDITPKTELARHINNNPFTKEISTSDVSPRVLTNPFLTNSFNENDQVEGKVDKTVKISFAIDRNPFDISENVSEDNDKRNKEIFKVDDVDNGDSYLSISPIELKVENESNNDATKIESNDIPTNRIDKVCNIPKKLCNLTYLFILISC